MNLLRNTRFVVFALLTAAGSIAASADEPRQYDIELLVFRSLVVNDAGEVWPRDYSTGYEQAGVALPPVSGAGQDVHWLPESSYHMKAERNALAGSAGYRPLAYLAWRQPVLDRTRAQPVQIPASGRRAGGSYVDGRVTVAVERYLHLNLDLRLHLPSGAVRAGDGGTTFTEPMTIPLTEQRRMRSSELHYFDNPRFGVIALITPYTPPTTAVGGTAPATTP